jgi:hypothetical protein
MGMVEMERHIGTPKEIKMGDDIFRFYPMSMEQIPIMYGELLPAIKKQVPEGTKDSDFMMYATPEIIISITKLIKIMCENSPDIDSTDKVKFDRFVSINFPLLMKTLFDINSEVMK